MKITPCLHKTIDEIHKAPVLVENSIEIDCSAEHLFAIFEDEEAWTRRNIERNWAIIESMGQLADVTGKSYSQIALNWLLLVGDRVWYFCRFLLNLRFCLESV